MGRPTVLTVGPLAAGSANNIAQSQAGTAATALTLNGTTVAAGVATLDKPRRVIVTSAGTDSAITFTITGTMFANGPTVTDVVTGGNIAAAQSALDFYTVASVVPSGNTAANVTVGTNGVASSRWMRFDDWSGSQASYQVDVTGTVNYTVEESDDDPNSPTNPVLPYKVTWLAHPVLNGKTASQKDGTQVKPAMVRLTLNSTGNTSSLATLTAIQAGSLFRP